jgi:uncharacterized membrane protein
MRRFVAVCPLALSSACAVLADGANLPRPHLTRGDWRCRYRIAFQQAQRESTLISGGVRAVPIHDWLMKRNCSLSPRQVGWFYLSIVSVSFAIALFFAWRGVWFVLPFAGLELLGLGIALLVWARHAADYERVTLADGMLLIEKGDAGLVTRQEFNPLWVRVELSESFPASVITLRSGKRAVRVGCFLDPYKRLKFAQDLAAALRGPPVGFGPGMQGRETDLNL